MAEIFRVENDAMAADRGLGDQGIEPAELLPDRKLVGIEDQIGIGAQHLKTVECLQQIGDLAISRDSCSLRLATERSSINTYVLITTSWWAMTSANHPRTRSDFVASRRSSR